MAPTDEKRQREINEVILKVIGVVAAVALVVGLGTWLMVRSLGLDDTGADGAGSRQIQPMNPLPTTALPVPTDSPVSPGPSASRPAADATAGGLALSATPVLVQPMDRIYLTGRWPGHDAVGLAVQREENGAWVDFGVQVNVSVGTFETYVMTGRSGVNRFRVLDPQTQTASNPVVITVS